MGRDLPRHRVLVMMDRIIAPRQHPETKQTSHEIAPGPGAAVMAYIKGLHQSISLRGRMQ